MKSENLNELFASLSLMQGQITGASKDAANPFFKSQYATLDACWEAIREPMSKNGLSLVQCLEEKEGKLYLTTYLGHKSGQYISATIPINPAKPGPQEFGSYITYMRRYSLTAIVGLTQSDDDGEKAQEGFRQSKEPDLSSLIGGMKKKAKELGYKEDHLETYISHLAKEKKTTPHLILSQAIKPELVDRFCKGWQKFIKDNEEK